MNIELIFPTAFGIENNFLKEKERKNLIEDIYKIKDSVPNTDNNGWLSGKNSPYNTIFTHNLINDENFNFLIDGVTKKIYEYAASYSDMDEYICQSAWINIYRQQNFQEPHNHPTIRYSAVYFPLVPAGSGEIVFQKPYIDQFSSINVKETNVFNCTHLPLLPEENSLIIFPSSLIHFVLPGNNIEDRVSIAFNFTPGVNNND